MTETGLEKLIQSIESIVDGSFDNSFNPGTRANNNVCTVTQQDDGKVLIGGELTIVNGTARNHIARLVTEEAELQSLGVTDDVRTVYWSYPDS